VLGKIVNNTPWRTQSTQEPIYQVGYCIRVVKWIRKLIVVYLRYIFPFVNMSHLFIELLDSTLNTLIILEVNELRYIVIMLSWHISLCC